MKKIIKIALLSFISLLVFYISADFFYKHNKKQDILINKKNNYIHSFNKENIYKNNIMFNNSLQKNALPWEDCEENNCSKIIKHEIEDKKYQYFWNINTSINKVESIDFKVIHKSFLINESEAVFFICPADVPNAISFSLGYENKEYNEDSLEINESPTIISWGYNNDCFSSKNYDLLYGESKTPSMVGNYINLSGFIDHNSLNGCKSGISYNQPIKYKINSNISINSVYEDNNVKNRRRVGFTSFSVKTIDCNSICNKMLDYYCDADPTYSYCGEEVINAIQSQNKTQNFCSCQIYNVAWGNKNWAFTNAVDIKNAVDFKNNIKTVTCSNVDY